MSVFGGFDEDGAKTQAKPNLVCKNGKSGIADKNGKTAIKAERDKVSEFKNGLAAVGV